MTEGFWENIELHFFCLYWNFDIVRDTMGSFLKIVDVSKMSATTVWLSVVHTFRHRWDENRLGSKWITACAYSWKWVSYVTLISRTVISPLWFCVSVNVPARPFTCTPLLCLLLNPLGLHPCLPALYCASHVGSVRPAPLCLCLCNLASLTQWTQDLLWVITHLKQIWTFYCCFLKKWQPIQWISLGTFN